MSKRKIRGELKTVDISEVYPNDYNYNEMSPEMVTKEEEAFKRFGVIRSILVRTLAPNYYSIIDGEHRYDILKRSGATKILIRDLGYISDEEAKSLTIVLDEIKGQTDFIKTAELFASIKDYTLEDITSFLPYKPSELQTMIDAIDFDFTEYGSPTDPWEDDMVERYVVVSCRVPKDDAGGLDTKAEALAADLGIKDKKESIQLGRVFTHLLKQTLQSDSE